MNNASSATNRTQRQRTILPEKQRCEGESARSWSSVEPFASHGNEGRNNITALIWLTQYF